MGFQSPSIGAWYFDREDQQVFEVVALDEQQGTIEVQYLDGAIGEFDLETWPQLPLVPAAAPEDSEAAYELSQEDRWNDDDVLVPDSWNNPLNDIEPDLFPGYDD
ncbi:DUF6763 family protein [Marinimicrobium sp. LS-A18]|uniref:DUF6763 family protein n=1 Tax=Marinimicrobium TaxID=359337 RepID=UPI0004666F4A|nr:DUF6763 family protein [Marinimicrobium sp. LS-A18]